MPMPTLTLLRALSTCALALLLVACATDGGRNAATPTPAPEPEPTPAPAPPPPPPPEPPPPAGPAAQAQAQKLAMGSIELLEAGQEDQARAELQKALALDHANKLANNLMRQITADPVAQLGRESFVYVVRPNDTLSRIAGRFMGDIYAFYILARYNDIKVPRQVAGGQQIRVPGKAPPPGALEPRDPPARAATAPTPAPPARGAVVDPKAATPAASAPPAPPPEPTPGERALRAGEAAERSGSLDRALEEYRRAVSLEQPGAAAKEAALRKRLVDRHALAARGAFAKQDLAGSIRAWDRVLELDPNNDLAKLERQKAARLKQKADELK
ncbi:LysM peptidoglycan-binding domain-containing protein [Roseateles sp. DAIF2]|uniref:LysM peptidoglycan-binding domain-containing protein n=1 Tax=Roseateles sp. DAIF2 TaxID=2714952 RepID=UPI0018A31E96|nr:LysM domain-containing protein [Roseateles sp. DAIF2]QPF75646.1 LysM peptidoglycan-binding domain-containing protein [Roseateles sp. DAIF2]